MINNNGRLKPEQGFGSTMTARDFFTNNGGYGIADATVFLDHVTPMSKSRKQKYAYLWELLKNGNNIIGMLESRKDKNEVPYVWLEVKLLRGTIEFKAVLFTPQMLDFFVKYQEGNISVRFTLQELIAEAERIEASQKPQND